MSYEEFEVIYGDIDKVMCQQETTIRRWNLLNSGTVILN